MICRTVPILNFFDFLMFADDCTITSSLPKYDLAECSGEINSNLQLYELLENWLKANKININADKTKYILIAPSSAIPR